MERQPTSSTGCMRLFLIKFTLFALCAFLLAEVAAGAAPGAPTAPARRDMLFDNFRRPPPSARPRVWWHWMNGNVTKTGIRKDIEWMARIGIGGLDCIDASIDTPQVVPHRLVYMTPPWQDAFRYTAALAGKYGLELSIDSSPGWSMTGGPWVPPQAAMKKAVWSTVEIEGGKPFHGVLPEPPGNIGPFQNAPFAGDIQPTAKAAALRFYRDSVVIAYRTPVEAPVVGEARTETGPLDAAMLSDGDVAKGVTLTPAGEDKDVTVRIVFEKPARIQGVSLAFYVTPKGAGTARLVEASDDGVSWRPVAEFPAAAQLQRMVMVQQTINFAPVTAKYFRLVLRPAPALPGSLRPRDPAPGLAETPPPSSSPRSYLLTELVFRPAATVNEFEKKAQFAAPPRDFYTLDSLPGFAPGSAVDPNSVVMLNGRMKPDGTLEWTPPPGRWTVLRMGYALTGAENHPATAEATGLEVDKLNARHVRAYLEHYLDTYERITGPGLFGRRGLRALMVDSSEIGMQNWSEDILAEFRRARGYDPVPWLPALTGIAVKSPADSDRFLWDWRRTIAELFARNHYGEIAKVDRQRGLLTYTEAIEDHRPTFGDDIETRRPADVPMGAMWTYGEKWPAALTYEADILGAASVAHVYGQNLVAAESLTSAGRPWAFAPRELKPIIDMEFVRGVNLVVIHTSVHQPVDKPPGLSLNAYGQFINRLESWAELAKPWVSYMARASYLLQQGRFAADIAYFYGEEAPLTSLFGNRRVEDVPEGYAFDFVDKDGLTNQLAVENGELVAPSGMHYRLLYLGGSSARMTLGALRRIAELARQGAVVVGRRPAASPSAADDEAEFDAAADDLFGKDGGVRAYGKGKVFASGSLAEALAALGLEPDFTYEKPQADSSLLFIHRRLKDGELYFVSNRQDREENVAATFRVAGYAPEIWDAVSGTAGKANYSAAEGRTRVALKLPPYGSTFVVFRQRSAAPSRAVPAAAGRTVLDIKGPWSISFQPGRGAPARLTLGVLQSWSDSSEPGVKYFSGIGTYTKTFTLPKSAFKRGARLVLDLGEVRELAEVTLNGRKLGIVWTAPFRFDVTGAAKPGTNWLTVKVANLWVNRLIGDAQPGPGPKYSFTIIPTYRADAPLRPSGLIGPVLVKQVE